MEKCVSIIDIKMFFFFLILHSCQSIQELIYTNFCTALMQMSVAQPTCYPCDLFSAVIIKNTQHCFKNC